MCVCVCVCVCVCDAVGWAMAVDDTYMIPAFNVSTTEYILSPPCKSFVVSGSIMSNDTCVGCQILIDGQPTLSQAFDTFSTSSLSVQVCQDCVLGPYLTYTSDVEPCMISIRLPALYLFSEFPLEQHFLS
jgi:hypothetical protein